jgi:aryl carrier-like protein
VLGTSATQVNVDQPLADMGLDSLMAVELAGGLGRDLGQPVSVMQMLSAGSLAAIAKVVMKMLGVEAETVAAPPASVSGSRVVKAEGGVVQDSQPQLQETRA